MAGSVRSDRRVLKRLIAETGNRFDDWLQSVTERMLGDIVQSFGTSPAGRVYGGHVASLPGYPPNIDTEALKRSMAWAKDARFRYLIHDGVEWGIYMEIGTSRVKKRPFVLPVFELWQDKLADDARQFGLIR